MTTTTSVSQVSDKRDMSELIHNVSPTKTPVFSLLGKRDVDNTLYEWQYEELAAPATNAAVEGADATYTTSQPTPSQNRTQIFTKGVKITGTADARSMYGRGKNDLGHQLKLRAKELKTDIEYALVGGKQAPVAGDASAVASRMGSIPHYISADTTVDAGAAALDEADVNAALEKVYTKGGEPGYMFIAPKHALSVAGFAGAAGRSRDYGTGTKLVNAINIIQTPHGLVTVVQDIHMDPTRALFLDPEYAKVCTFRDVKLEEMAKTGDFKAFQMVGEFGCEVSSPFAHAQIENLV